MSKIFGNLLRISRREILKNANNLDIWQLFLFVSLQRQGIVVDSTMNKIVIRLSVRSTPEGAGEA